MITNESKELARRAMEKALQLGCEGARVGVYNGLSNTVEVRDGKIDRLYRAAETNLVLQLFIEGRYGSYSTNRLDWREVEKLIGEGVVATRYLAEDRARTLPDPARYYKGEGADLQLIDPAFDRVLPEEKVELAMQTCGEMMGKDARILSANASYNDEKDFKYLVASNGFEGEDADSSFSLVGSVSVRGEGDARPEAYWYDASLYFADLQKQGIGTVALARALQKVGQRKAASGRYPLVVDPMNAGRLLSPLIDALYGSAIHQKNSFLLDRLGEQVLGCRMTLIDEPHAVRTSGARYFDGEGVATQRRRIFEEGVLRNYFIDTYSSNKLAMAPTVASPSRLTMPWGRKGLEELVREVERGILVTGFNGGNCNSTTGDFSYGIEGFLIERGERVHPISEMNVTGNMLTLWNSLVEVGNDPQRASSWQIPSLLFDGVDFSGL